jgi:hypothetical protein
MVLQAALGHVLVHQQELLVLPAVPQQPHLRLHITVITNYIISRKNRESLGSKCRRASRDRKSKLPALAQDVKIKATTIMSLG